MAQNATHRTGERHPADQADRAECAMTVADRIAWCRSIIRQGAMIETILGEGFRQNSAVTMLLDLYACELEERPAYLWQVCMATTVPVSTAYRRLEALHRIGLIERHVADRDHRRIILRLTWTGRDRIDHLLRAFEDSQRVPAKGSGHERMTGRALLDGAAQP